MADDKLVPEDALKEALRKLNALPKEAVEKIKAAVPPSPEHPKKK